MSEEMPDEGTSYRSLEQDTEFQESVAQKVEFSVTYGVPLFLLMVLTIHF